MAGSTRRNSLPAQPSRAQGGAEQESERGQGSAIKTRRVGRAQRGRGANAGIGRISEEPKAMLRVTQTRSTISHIARNRATARALGLRGIGSSVEVVDNEATRGMVRQIRFLVSVEEVAARASSASRTAARRAPADEPEETA